jgi:hypothetical protein
LALVGNIHIKANIFRLQTLSNAIHSVYPIGKAKSRVPN